MPRLFIARAFAVSALLIATPLLAADAASPLPWPWKAKPTLDPSLALMTHIDDVSVSVSKDAQPVVTVSVKATAPAAGFTQPQLIYRLGDPNDMKFEFDARGRPPQDQKQQTPTPVTIDASYADAPVAKIKVISVYGKDNCIAYSVADGTKSACAVKASVPPQ